MINAFEKWLSEQDSQLTKTQFLTRASAWISSNCHALKTSAQLLNVALSEYHQSPHTNISQNSLLYRLVTNTPAVSVRAFRGEYGGGKLLDSRRASLSFGSEDIAKLYAQKPNDRGEKVVKSIVIEADIAIFNPVINDPEDPFIDGEVLIERLGPAKAKQIMDWAHGNGLLANTDNYYQVCEEFGADDYDELMELGGRDALEALYVDAYPIFDRHEFVSWFIDAGFDGLVQGGNGESALDVEYKLFSPEQVDIKQVHDVGLRPELNSTPDLVRQRVKSPTV